MMKIVLLADVGHLKAFQWEENEQFSKPRLSLIGQWDTNVPNHLRAELTDQAGRFRKGSVPSGPSDLSDGEEHNLELERRRRALKTIALRMRDLLRHDKNRGVYLAAPAEINRQLLKQFSPADRARIERNLKLDLTRLPFVEVIRQFSGSVKTKGAGLGVFRRSKSPLTPLDGNKKQVKPIQKTGVPSSPRQNLNVKRKPSSRRPSPFRKMMRKQTISNQVLDQMYQEKGEGDSRRTKAQTHLRRRFRRSTIPAISAG
jgi:hypothetical protein